METNMSPADRNPNPTSASHRAQIRAQHLEHWPLERLIPYAQNARTHSDAQIAQIAASILEYGFMNPILINSHGEIIAGHGRVLAAQKLGLELVPVIVFDHLTKTQQRAYIITDNRLAEGAGWDEELLRIELAALEQESFDLSLLGFEDEELGRLLAEPDGASGLTDEDAEPELREQPITLSGDLWILGDHRVLCGDATRQTDVDRLMAGELADRMCCNYGDTVAG